MSAVQTVWKPFRDTFPNHSCANPLDRARENFIAAEALMSARSADKTSAVSFGWNYTNSVTLGEPSGGTAAKPNVKYWYHRNGNILHTKWVRADCTWTGAVITKIAFYYSNDNRATWAPMTCEMGNYVVTITYSGADITETTWGNVP